VKQRVAPYLYFSSLYFISVGVLYLWGYWGRFNINIMEYLGLADIIKLAAYPIASAFLFFIVGTIIGDLLARRQRNTPDSGRGASVKRFPLRSATIILLVGAALALVLMPKHRWQMIASLVAIPFCILADRRNALIGILPSERARSVVIYLLAVLPIWAYGHGRLEATKIIEGTEYNYLASHSIAGMSLGDPTHVKNRAKYVGLVNSHLFLLLPEATLFVVPFEKTEGLLLKSFKTSSLF
jgi:hypothetical protein